MPSFVDEAVDPALLATALLATALLAAVLEEGGAAAVDPALLAAALLGETAAAEGLEALVLALAVLADLLELLQPATRVMAATPTRAVPQVLMRVIAILLFGWVSCGGG